MATAIRFTTTLTTTTSTAPTADAKTTTPTTSTTPNFLLIEYVLDYADQYRAYLAAYRRRAWLARQLVGVRWLGPRLALWAFDGHLDCRRMRVKLTRLAIRLGQSGHRDIARAMRRELAKEDAKYA